MINKTVKLYLNRINVDMQPIIDFAKAYNLKHGVQLTFTTEIVDVHGYTSSDFSQIRTGINYCILLGSETLFPIDPTVDINIFVFDQNEWKTPAGSPYPLLPDTPTSDTIVVNGKPYINLGVYSPQLNSAEITLCHELMHAYGKEAQQLDLPFEDCMDLLIVGGVPQPYYLNDQPDNPNSNFINQWERLIACGYFKALEQVVFPPQN